MSYEVTSLIDALNENGIHVVADRAFDKIAFDFSKHDKKVAEEKDKRIAELEKENSALKEKLSLIRTRTTEEARDFWDKDMFGSLVVTVPKKSNAENKINLNDRVKVKLTLLGVEIYYHQYDDLNKQIKDNGGTPLEPVMPQIDKDGYTEFQLHHFISLYGKHIGMAKPNVIQPLNIVIV